MMSSLIAMPEETVAMCVLMAAEIELKLTRESRAVKLKDVSSNDKVSETEQAREM